MSESKQIIGFVEGDAVPQIFINKIIDYYKQGKFPLEKLMKFYQFKDVERAFEDFENGKVVKPVILFD